MRVVAIGTGLVEALRHGGRSAKWAAVVLGALHGGCPQSDAEPPAPKACTSLGQRCQLSPGKLGSCVIVDDCQEESCFVCQSQH